VEEGGDGPVSRCEASAFEFDVSATRASAKESASTQVCGAVKDEDPATPGSPGAGGKDASAPKRLASTEDLSEEDESSSDTSSASTLTIPARHEGEVLAHPFDTEASGEALASSRVFIRSLRSCTGPTSFSGAEPGSAKVGIVEAVGGGGHVGGALESSAEVESWAPATGSEVALERTHNSRASDASVSPSTLAMSVARSSSKGGRSNGDTTNEALFAPSEDAAGPPSNGSDGGDLGLSMGRVVFIPSPTKQLACRPRLNLWEARKPTWG